MLMARNTPAPPAYFQFAPNAFARTTTVHAYLLISPTLTTAICVSTRIEIRIPWLVVCTVRYKGLLFTARFIFHRNIMENGPNVMRGVQSIRSPPPLSLLSLPPSLSLLLSPAHIVYPCRSRFGARPAVHFDICSTLKYAPISISVIIRTVIFTP